MQESSCLGFGVDCGVMLKGIGVTVAAFILFVGSVYVLLAAVFGRWLGYLVLTVCFAGWMMLLSSLWLFGFYSQGPTTPTNLGPRGADPTWLVQQAGLQAGSKTIDTFDSYPGAPWAPPDETAPETAGEIQAVGGAATKYLAAKANEEQQIPETSLQAISATQFTVDSISFATATDGTEVAVVTAHFNSGGPETTLSMYFDDGTVPRYSYMFLGGSILLFLIHLPLLDRAEKKRKEFLTGGDQPPWFGPA